MKLLNNEKVEYENDIANGAVYSRFDQSVCVKEGKNWIKGIIFDLDDTLYSEKEYVRSGFKAVSDYLGGGYEEKLWQYFEDGKVAITELLKSINRIDEDRKCLEIYRSHKPKIHLYDGVAEMLEKLRESGFRLGIITDGRPEGQRNKLDALGLWKMVDDVIITDEIGGLQFRKPCEYCFRIMMTKWKLKPSDMVYAGDNVNKDFQAPQQLGMKSVWFKMRTAFIFTSLGNICVQLTL